MGRGVPSPLVQKKVFDFWSPNSDFWCIVWAILRFSGLLRRQPLHDSRPIMSVTGAIAGSSTEDALVDNRNTV